MSVRRHRHAVAEAEATLVAAMADSYDRSQELVDTVRAAATPLRVGLVATLTGGALVLLRPKFSLLLRLPMLIGAVDSLVQHVGRRSAAQVPCEADPQA